MSFLDEISADKNTRFLIFLFLFFFSAIIFLKLNEDIHFNEPKKRYRDNIYHY